MSFLAPALLWAVVLASAPIIIHLLNRRRFIRVDWAPMKYLKLTLKANRRRLRIEQWILLAVRTLAVAALIFAIARPMSSTTDLAGFLKVQGRASRVLVIDDSLSMTNETQGVTAFTRAKQAAEQIVQALGTQDSLTVCTTSRMNSPLVRHARLESVDSLISQIQSLEPSDVISAWPKSLATADEHLSGGPFPIKEVLLVTDLWEAGWSKDAAVLCDRWADDKVALRIVDVGQEPQGNRRIVSLTQTDPVALIDTEVKFTAQVRNDGRETMKAEPALLTIDEATQSVTLPDIPPGETVDVPVMLTFDHAGQHRIALQLPTDPVLADNTFRITADVRRQIEVTLVDGDPGLKPFESETDFLTLALTAGNSQWKASPIISSEWLSQPLAAPDVMVLANVDRIPPERAKELTQMVEAGMGLMIYAGDTLDTAAWNDVLYKDGQGLLPARLEQIREAESTGLVVEPIADSPMSALLRISPEALTRVRPKRILETSLPGDASPQVRVLARWNDARQTPALIEKRFGLGRVFLWTVSADREWSDWPTEASFVLATRLSAQAIAARITRWENLIVGLPLRYPLDPDLLPQSARLTRISSEQVLEPQIKRDAVPPELFFDDLRLAGFYQANWDEPGGDSKSRLFAATADFRDSEPARLNDETLRPMLGRLTPKMLRFSGETMSLAAEGTELWRTLAAVMIGLLLFESLFAAWVGRVR
jgi:hypothetical protein